MTDKAYVTLLVIFFFIGMFILSFIAIKASAQTTATAHVENNPVSDCVELLTNAGYLPVKK